MLDVLQHQYGLIRSTRQLLFAFLEEIPLKELHTTIPTFGSGSILKTHIHVADSYRYWLGSFALKQPDIPFATATDVKQARERFDLVDGMVQKFLEEFDSRWFENVVNHVDWQEEPISVTPIWLLSHTETHEFHHKGQIVSMARHLGYNPPENDSLGGLRSKIL